MTSMMNQVTTANYFERDKGIALRYFSLPYKSLQQLGDQHGISRERVRQVCNVVLRKSGVPKGDNQMTYDLPRLRGDEEVISAIRSLTR